MKHYILIVAVSLAATATAQVTKPASIPSGTGSTITGQISQIPLYPGSVVPPELSGKLLFFDPESRELVISYPDNVADPNFALNPGPRTVVRTKLKKDIRVLAFVAIAKDVMGSYGYSYTLANQLDAKQGVSHFSLPVPSPGSNLPAGAVSSEIVTQNAPSILGNASGWTSRLTSADRGVVQLEWSTTTGEGLPPGGLASGFNASSALKPGFVHAIVRGFSGLPLTISNLPLPVQQSLVDLENSGYNQQVLMTLGPQFSASTNLIAIAANFLEGIATLKHHGYLDSASPFVQEATVTLTQFLEGTRFGSNGPAADYKGPSLVVGQRPIGPLESQIYEAMKLSLDLK
jgi:hypothetical protein